jgi:hypothetical protein
MAKKAPPNSFSANEQLLLRIVGYDPLSFRQIAERAFPADTNNGLFVRKLGASKLPAAQSLRRALIKLWQRGIVEAVIIGGRRPAHHRLAQPFRDSGIEHNAKAIIELFKRIQGNIRPSISTMK